MHFEKRFRWFSNYRVELEVKGIRYVAKIPAESKEGAELIASRHGVVLAVEEI